MMAEHAGEQIVARIGFAERWLERARGQVVAGNLTRGILTLVLANAEVHHALEVAGAQPSRPRMSRPVLVRAVVTIAVLVTVSAVWLAADPNSDAATVDQAPPIVSLSPGVGMLLNLLSPVSPEPPIVAISPTHTPAAVREVPVRIPARLRSPHRPATQPMSVPANGPVTGPPQMNTAQPTPVPPPAPAVQAIRPAVPQLSAGDLIDLVLAAERALRSDSTPP